MTVEIRSAPMTESVGESVVSVEDQVPYSARTANFSEMRVRQQYEDKIDGWRRADEEDANAKDLLAIHDGVTELAIVAATRASADLKIADEVDAEKRLAKRDANEEKKFLDKGARTKVVRRTETAVETEIDDSYYLRAAAHAESVSDRAKKSKERSNKSGLISQAQKRIEANVKRQIIVIPATPEREEFPTPRIGNYRSQFDAVGADIAKVEAEVAAIQKLRPADDELFAQLDRIYDEIPTPKITVHRSGVRVLWPMKTVHGTHTDNYQRVIEGPVAAKLANPDGLRKNLRELLTDTLALEGGESIGAAERERRLNECAENLFNLGLIEEGIVRAAHAEGIELMRRGDADPRCVLGVSRKYRRAA